MAVVGSGPAGLACAQQLARAGHSVTVFERADRIGGLLRYGIPDFKMEKRLLDRRLRADGSRRASSSGPATNVGVDITAQELLDEFDAVCLCGGATQPRDLPIEGRELERHPLRHAVPDRAEPAGRRRQRSPTREFISARDKHVIIIGGGDTGADCLGTVHRQGCKSVHQFEIVPRPPDGRDAHQPLAPVVQRLPRLVGPRGRGHPRVLDQDHAGSWAKHGRVRALETVHVEMKTDNGRLQFVEIPGTETVYPADLVLLAMGFVGPERKGMLEQFGVELDAMGNVKADADKRTSVAKVFTAGDMTRGQSLIVWAIAEGRHAAHAIDESLMGSSDLPRPLEHGNDRRPFA